MARPIPAEGEALGNQRQKRQGLKARPIILQKTFLAGLYPAPSGLVCFRLVTQGVALGWYVSPLQGCQEWRGHSCLRAYTRADRNVCPTLV